MPPKWQRRFRQAYLSNAHRNLILLRELEATVAALDAAGVPTIVLKGGALARVLYRNIALRPLMDIDLLIRREHLDDALHVLARCGFAPTRPETRGGATAYDRVVSGWARPHRRDLHRPAAARHKRRMNTADTCLGSCVLRRIWFDPWAMVTDLRVGVTL